MRFICCQNCNKKLLKIGQYDELAIKCPRCKTINHLSVQNAANAGNEAHEALQSIQGERPRGNKPINPPQTL